jgi:hypothetical protein
MNFEEFFLKLKNTQQIQFIWDQFLLISEKIKDDAASPTPLDALTHNWFELYLQRYSIKLCYTI